MGMLWSGHGGDLPPSFTSADVDSVVCKKTVLDWLQTSFHYEHLPYIRMHSVFKNGEGYSRGCMRCARPFFEYEHLYAHYLYAIAGTQHWPHMYWKCDAKDCGGTPQPFHDDTSASGSKTPCAPAASATRDHNSTR